MSLILQVLDPLFCYFPLSVMTLRPPQDRRRSIRHRMISGLVESGETFATNNDLRQPSCKLEMDWDDSPFDFLDPLRGSHPEDRSRSAAHSNCLILA